jgi:hypothetical protein
MKKRPIPILALALGLLALGSCQQKTDHEDKYFEVIGEYEQQTPEAGYRLNLSYNGPIDKRDEFVAWADSLKQKVPNMVKTNEGIFVNYMPEQAGKKIRKDMYQTNVTYLLTVADSTLYGQLTKDLLKRDFAFNINVMGVYLDPASKAKLQQDMMQKALDNAKTKLDFLTGKDRAYEIVSIEELDNNTPYGPEYYDYNRKMVARLKVKAELD